MRGLALPASMDNALRLTDSIRAGCIYGAISRDVKLPHVATRDVGAAAANLLLDRSWIGQKDVTVLGPEEHSYTDISRIISEETRYRCGYQQVPFDEWKARLVGVGMARALRRGLHRDVEGERRRHGQRCSALHCDHWADQFSAVGSRGIVADPLNFNFGLVRKRRLLSATVHSIRRSLLLALVALRGRWVRFRSRRASLTFAMAPNRK